MAGRRSVMEHQFSKAPSVGQPRSSFDRSHGCKTTLDGGLLVPILADEALPGDTFNLNMTAFARLATPIHPIMDNLFMDSFFFAVPVRLLWDNWEKFNGAQTDPGDSTDFTVPVLDPVTPSEMDLHDYLGLPIDNALSGISALWHRAYNLIYNEWFRDQNLQTSRGVPTDNGPDAVAQYTLMRRGKRHDYFTSCLPWPQKDSGSIPVGTVVPVISNLGIDGQSGVPVFEPANGTPGDRVLGMGTGDQFVRWEPSNPAALQDARWSTTSLVADLSAELAINAIREGFQVQKLLERDARGGTRYTEIIRSHFGVVSPDARLQRPEYLGGGSSAVTITPVPQTSETDGSPQGNLAGYGTVGLGGHGFTKSFTEHCVIIGLINVRADLTYSQGIERQFSRSTRFDFYWPSLSHLGEQAVLSKEVFADGSSGDEDVFGYQERYAEYRYKPSRITGLFRTDATGTLDPWHLSQDFSPRPTLNSTFIQEDPPIDRVIAVPSEPHFLFDAYFSMRCARPMPLYGVPGLIDHF